MKIGICGNYNEIEEALKGCDRREIINAQFHKYNLDELTLDVEEGFFDCDILFVYLFFNMLRKENYFEIDLVKKINDRFPRCQVIYVTDSNRFIDEIYDTKHVYLLAKEYMNGKIDKACEKALDALDRVMDKDVIEIKSLGCKYYLHREQILYVERDGRRVRVVTPGNTYYCYESVKEIKKKLDERMIQINGGGIVNLRYITYLGKGTAELFCEGIETVFPVGRTYIKSVKEAYYEFWKKDSG